MSTADKISLLMPSNFSMVEKGIYRSSFPRTKNIDFLRNLGLRTVVSLVLEDYPAALVEFYEKSGISLVRHGLEGNKGPFKGIDTSDFANCLIFILNPANHPLLLHCNKGKHRTGSIVACIRRLRGWALSAALHEYLLFSAPKSRLEDQRFIELFDEENFIQLQSKSKEEDERKLTIIDHSIP
jgi:tyrosine-protein phosphatase SIW14